MPKLEVDEYLGLTTLPSSAQLRLTMGKKVFTQFKNIMMKNGEDKPAQNLLELDDFLNQTDSFEYGFGATKLFNRLLCLILAAQLDSENKLVHYDKAIQVCEDMLFKQELFDPSLNRLHEQLIETKEKFKAKPFEVEGISQQPLKQLIEEAYSLKDMTLATRLDLQFEIYKLCTSLLTSGSVLTVLELDRIREYQTKALCFLEKVLDSKGIEEVEKLMEFRLAKKERFPEYIPRATPVTFVHSLPRTARTNIQAMLLRAYENEMLKQAKNLLEITASGKEKDLEEKTIFLNADKRDELRVILAQGKIWKRLANNDFQLYDSTNNISKTGKGYAAFVLNKNGELSLFDHYDSQKPFFHSSPNAQAYIFCAGEIKIKNGQITELTTQSGHYKPDKENIVRFLKYLQDRHIDVSHILVKILSIDPDTKETEYKVYNTLDLMANPTATEEIKMNEKKSEEKILGFDQDFEVNWDEPQPSSDLFKDVKKQYR